MFVEGHIRSK